MTKILLVSSGIDSYIMSQEIIGTNVYIDFGQGYAEEEKEALNNLNIPFDLITINSKYYDYDKPSSFIPGRNLMLASVVNTVYEPDEIYMACLKDDYSHPGRALDQGIEEYQNMSEILSKQSGKQVKVISPYFDKTKYELVRDFGNKKELLKTFSCYTPIDGKPCGDCDACFRRVVALESNGIKTGIEISKRIKDSYMRDLHNYNKDYIKQVIEWYLDL